MSETNQSDSDTNVGDILERAIELHRNGELTNAEWAYQEVLEHAPEHPDALHLLGVLAHQLGDTDTAIERVQASLEHNPDQPSALNNLGNIFAGAKRSDEAIETYQKAIELRPDYAEAIHNLGNVFNDLDRLAESIDCFRRATELVQDDSTTWSALGAAYEKVAQFDDAIQAFETACKVDDDAVSPLSRLGAIYRKLGRIEDAKAAYRSWLAIRPDDPIATHLLQACGETETPPERASADYVRSTFDSYAEDFDKSLEGLEYRVPDLLGDLADRFLADGDASDRTIVDLGCGTGLCGPRLRPLAKRVIGVDLSPNMLFYANQRETYDDLVESDLVEYLTGTEDQFDLILSADTLIYLGDLRATFTAAAKTLKDGGKMIFSLESLGDQESGGDLESGVEAGYRLMQSGRFAHHEDCVRAWLAEVGLELEFCQNATLRKEADSTIEGFLVVAAKEPT